MPSRVAIGRIIAGLLLSWSAVAAVAEDTEPRRGYSSMLNIDAMIDSYARLLTRKYNLTSEQDAFTQAYLREKSQQFLDRHRDQLFQIVDRMFEVRAGADITQQEMMEWGRQAQPLFDEARQLIIEGNNEWRAILTEDQKRIHDADLELMRESFTSTQDQLTRISSGQMTLEEFRRGQPRPSRKPRDQTPVAVPPEAPALAPGGPVVGTAVPAPATPGATTHSPAPAPPKPMPAAPGSTHGTPTTPGGKPAPTRPGGPATANFESEWEAYVREFTQRYQLDEAQKQRAQVILRDCQDQARNYMTRRKSQMDDLDRRAQQANDIKDAKEKARRTQEIADRRTRLLSPINDIRDRQLKPRLERLLSPAQKQAGDARPAVGAGRPGVPGVPGATPVGHRPVTPGQPIPGKPQQPQPQPQPRPQPQPPPPPQPEPQPEPLPEPQPEEMPEDAGEQVSPE